VAIWRQDWDAADKLAQQALEIMRDGHLDDYIMSPLVHAVAGRTALHRGDAAGAKEHLARAARLRPLLTSGAPHIAVQALLELARAYLTLGDAVGARTVLRQARDIVQLRPDLGILPSQAEELQERLAAVRGGPWGPPRSPPPSCACCRSCPATLVTGRSASDCTSPGTR
jgi:hypothetical protein